VLAKSSAGVGLSRLARVLKALPWDWTHFCTRPSDTRLRSSDSRSRATGGWAGCNCCAHGCFACCCAPTSRWCSRRICQGERGRQGQGGRPVAR